MRSAGISGTGVSGSGAAVGPGVGAVAGAVTGCCADGNATRPPSTGVGGEGFSVPSALSDDVAGAGRDVDGGVASVVAGDDASVRPVQEATTRSAPRRVMTDLTPV